MPKTEYGPKTEIAQHIHAEKYRSKGETFYDAMVRVAAALADSEDHRLKLKDALLEQRFLPAGRIQAAAGSPRRTTLQNCYVAPEIKDDFDSIMDAVKKAGRVMRLGGGIGYDFSKLRPNGAHIATLDSHASGPVSFMEIFDATCKTISSAGHRRGAQMGILRVDHPDIEEFITVKNDLSKLTGFNLSVGITNAFMEAVKNRSDFELKHEGNVYRTVDAYNLFEMILRSTWDYAEPGVVFLDRFNTWNNLHYCETINATNPCGEQPLPHNGACLLGSLNTVKYLTDKNDFDFAKFETDIAVAVRALDSVVDRTLYPLHEMRDEGQRKRRMGLGVTGMANAIETMGHPYGTPEYIKVQSWILKSLRDTAYTVSTELASDMGAFPAFEKEKYLRGKFIETLPNDIIKRIEKNGIRNSHLTSIAPTGTISLAADNVSGGVEPVFTVSGKRTIKGPDGADRQILVEDYGKKFLGTDPKTADQVTPEEHVNVLCEAQKFVDSAISKTVNIGDDIAWDEFKNVYMHAYEGGAKGCSTFRLSGKRFGVLESMSEDGGACTIDPESGMKSCA